MPKPGALPDQWGGYTIEVMQCDWGHIAEKRTWLYIVGITDLPAMPPSRPVDRSLDYRKPSGRWSTALERMAKSKRHITPPAFAAWLVEVARRCAKD